jgi:hypothetical protein
MVQKPSTSTGRCRPVLATIRTMTAPAVIALVIMGCAGGQLKQARDAFYIDGDPDGGAQMLAEKDGPGLSRLLFSMEKGLLLHYAGRFEESTDQLRQASALMDRQDYLSVSQQTASLVINDWMTEYKGEYCERLWVHTYLMINYLMVQRYEDALVEAKQALQRIDAYPDALAEAYFSQALIGLCYELLGEFNDAYIVYKGLAETMPDPTPIRETMRRMGRLAGIEPALAEMTNRPPPGPGRQQASADPGELILFIDAGRGPVKEASNIILPPGVRISFPRYQTRSAATGRPNVLSGGRSLPARVVSTDLNRVTRVSLNERAKQVIVKETARVLAKEAIAREVEKESDAFVGFMARMVLMAIEEADTRSWQTLPATQSLVRIPLDPGTHHLTVTIDDAASGGTIDLPPVTLQNGQRRFLVIRATDRFSAIYGNAGK